MAKRGPSQLNMIMAVDKPVGCTSHDVVARVRRSVGERRVGHAGTLDPLASGVMLIGIGQATRLLGMLTLDTKSYVADIALGSETNTDDAEGEVTRAVPVPAEANDPEYAREALTRCVGKQMQVPPAFSAISVNGVRAYKSARAGNEVQFDPRPIEVLQAELIAITGTEAEPVWTVAFHVSKGTYIRALARDLGRAIGSAAHLSALRRTASGDISLASCIALDEVSAARAREVAFDPVRALGLESVRLESRYLDDILCGRKLAPSVAPHACEGERLALVIADELRALARRDAHAITMTDVFPQGITGVSL